MQMTAEAMFMQEQVAAMRQFEQQNAGRGGLNNHDNLQPLLSDEARRAEQWS